MFGQLVAHVRFIDVVAFLDQLLDLVTRLDVGIAHRTEPANGHTGHQPGEQPAAQREPARRHRQAFGIV